MKVTNIFGLLQDKANKIKQDKLKYEEIVSKSLKFDNLFRLDINKKKDNEGKIEEIVTMCPNLTRDKAKFIYDVIPLWEVLLYIAVISEKISGNKFYLVATNRWIWIINDYSYKIINYNEVYLLEIIKKSLMVQVVNFNQIVLNFTDYINNVNTFIELVSNKDYREKVVLDNSKYLCGIIPTYQVLNKIQSGISMDKDNNLVFHDKKKNNIRCRYDEILDYEILEDQTSVLKKKKDNDSHAIPFAKDTCSRISIRITFNDNKLFMMSILEPSSFYSQYNHTDSIYINNFKFAKEIIDFLESLNNR